HSSRMQNTARFTRSGGGIGAATAQVIGGAAFLTVVVIFFGELSTPRDISVASLAVVPVAVAAWYTELAYRPLVLFAVAMAVLGAVVGSVSPQSAASTCAACIAMTVLVRAARRSGDGSPMLRSEVAPPIDPSTA